MHVCRRSATALSDFGAGFGDGYSCVLFSKRSMWLGRGCFVSLPQHPEPLVPQADPEPAFFRKRRTR
jgi:hypothetical protein